MKIWTYGKTLAVMAAIAWPMADGTVYAQRDGGGQRNSGGQRSGGSDRGGGPRSSGNRDGGGQRARGGERGSGQRSSGFSGGQRSSSGDRDSSNRNRGESNRNSGRNFNRESMDRGSADRARETQRSFYRGDVDQLRNNRGREDRDRADSDRERSNREFDRSSRERTDRDRSNSEWNNRERSDWDRNDWDRLGRNDRRGRWDDIRRDWWRNYDRDNVPFRSGWWNSYSGAGWPVYSPYGYGRYANRPYYWWGYTPATRLTDWLAFGWDRPRYWGYGPGANIYYRDDYVYYDNRRTIPVNDYYQQLYDLAHDVPNISENEAEQMDWSPLGVFAINRENEQQSQRALQLAVNQNGVISGTYFNRENGHVHPVSGMVDERTQRAAWAFADGEHEDVVFETALYNLTRQESTMMVHFGPAADDTEVWQLVRLEQPDSQDATSLPRQQSNSTRTLP